MDSSRTGMEVVYLCSETGVRIVNAARNTVLLGNGFNLQDQTDNRLIFFVGLTQSGFELLVSIQQSLDLLHRVDDEHIHQILSGSVQPVIKWLKSFKQFIEINQIGLIKSIILINVMNYSSTLGEFQMELINFLEDSFGILQSLTTGLG